MGHSDFALLQPPTPGEWCPTTSHTVPGREPVRKGWWREGGRPGRAKLGLAQGLQPNTPSQGLEGLPSRPPPAISPPRTTGVRRRLPGILCRTMPGLVPHTPTRGSAGPSGSGAVRGADVHGPAEPAKEAQCAREDTARSTLLGGGGGEVNAQVPGAGGDTHLGRATLASYAGRVSRAAPGSERKGRCSWKG